ncbi:MAG TPA: hypothetical protein VNQ32_09555 [Steroidobacteraceae bacterium]|nr:hypothetical protein [Steroidobacteraceae bacterium]
MLHPPRTRRSVRTVAGFVTLAVHGLFAMLLLGERDDKQPRARTERTLQGTWIHLLPLTEPEFPEQDVVQPAVPVAPARATAVRPPTAISLAPAPEAPPASDDGAQGSTQPGIDSRPWTDWDLEAEKLAARRQWQDEPEGFSGPLQALREPCKPHQSSMFPKKKEVEDAPPTWQDAARPPPGSVMMGGTRVGVVGAGIPLGRSKPEPNKHLFDDMMAGKTPRSSVPDPNVCD